MSHKNTDVQTAAALGFAEHLLDTDKRKAIIPKIMSRSDFISIRNLLEYHNSPADVEHYLKASWI